MYLLWVFGTVLGFVSVVVAPPTTRCVVATPIFQSTSPKTACDDGDHTKLSIIATEPHLEEDLYGAANMADLILSRGGIFDSQRRDLDDIHICQKHHDEFGLGWSQKLANRPLKKGPNQLACAIPKGLAGFSDHKRATLAQPRVFVNKEQSEAIYVQKNALAPAGTGKT